MATPTDAKPQSGKNVLLGVLGFMIGIILLLMLIKYLLG